MPSELARTAAAAVPKDAKTARDWVLEYQPELEKALADQIDPEHFVRGVLTVLTGNVELQQADPKTLVSAILLAAQLGLEVGGGLNQFHLTPREITVGKGDEARKQKVCVPIIGYQGYLTLAYRSGRVLDFQKGRVREGDEFDYRYTTEKGLQITWVPVLPIDLSKPVTGVIMRSKLLNGGIAETYLTRSEIERRRPEYTKEQTIQRGQRAGQTYVPNTPWKTNWEAMADKTVAREHTKYLPKSVQLEWAAAMDGRVVVQQPNGEVAPMLERSQEFGEQDPDAE